MKIKAGTILVITHGEYSDYGYSGPFHVLKDFDQAEIAEEFRNAWKALPHDKWDRASESDFMNWANREGYIEDVANGWSWHVGGYGFEPDIDTEPDAPSHPKEPVL
jgi:hypothetical protein